MIATFSLINRLPRAAADHRQRTLLRRCGFSGFTWEDIQRRVRSRYGR